ncbi:hypothetical protein ALC57_06713, partial [Trachymyrmex cornetzi]
GDRIFVCVARQDKKGKRVDAVTVVASVSQDGVALN